MNNCTHIPPSWPNISSSYIQAYDFEVFDFPKTCSVMTSLRPLVIPICVTYVLSIFLGQRIMRDREPFSLKGPLLIWNISLALFSTIGFLRVFPETYYLLTSEDGFYDAICKTDTHNYATSFWAILMIQSKLVELGDTAFIILRKKKLIFLHWYHHLTVFFFSYTFFDTYDPMFRIAGVVNYFVHAVMYTYYALMTMNMKLPKQFAAAITTLQIIQMIVALFGHGFSTILKLQGVPCGRPWKNILCGFLVGPSYLILFINYFRQTYYVPRKSKGQ